MMNSTMGDRGDHTPPPGMWPWYNMYQHPYQTGYQPYGHQGYYPYYPHGHPGMPFHHGSPQQSHHSLMGMPPGGEPIKGFVSGGQLLPFNEQQNGIINNSDQPLSDQRNRKDNPSSKEGDKKGDMDNSNKNSGNNINNDCGDMPPLPPGPPPPMMRFPTPPPPGTSPTNRFYQPNGMGPVKFSFGSKSQIRPGGYGGNNNINNMMNENNSNVTNSSGPNNNTNNNNAVSNNNNGNGQQMFICNASTAGGSGSGKKKRKRNKGGNQNKMGGGMLMKNEMVTLPPPPHVLLKVPPPPLPPGPPPIDQPPLPPSPDDSSAPLISSGNRNTGGHGDDMNLERDNVSRDSLTERQMNNIFKSYNYSSGRNQSNSMRPNSMLPNSMLSLEECPQSLKNYMERCYSKCVTPMDHDRVDIILKGKIMRASSDDTLWTKDWDNEPLPLLANELENITLKTSSPQSSQHDISPPRKQGKGLSAALESRLGGRKSAFSHKNRSPVRNKSSPKRRRERSESSSSSDENYKPIKSSKSSKMGKFNKNRNSSSKNKGKQSKQIKSHFYMETGFIEDTNPEILEKRAARFSSSSSHNKSHNTDSSHSSVNSLFQEYQSPLASMRRKKALKLSFDSCNNSFQDSSGDFDFADCHIIGNCQDIEKPYLRLTAAPEASAVRPPNVLQLSLARVKERWVQNQDYFYACEQLKSIRQDLTVQGIRDSLTVKVYETHARIALEKGDHAEFNQCQSQLRSLYMDVDSQNRLEFTAYRILYHIFTKDFMDLQTILASLSDEDKKDECVGHALKVRSAWWLSNYHRLFKLYKNAPRMSSYLMDWFLPRERKLALKAIIKSYRPNLAVEFVSQELAFDKEEEFFEFLGQFGVIYADGERTKIDCKASGPSVSAA